MQHDITFVTAIYNSPDTSIIGGRTWHTHYYKPCIGTICSFGVPVIIYTHAHEEEPVRDAFASFNFTNYTLILRELEDFEYSDYLVRIKTAQYDKDGFLKNGQRNDRCHHICWQKLYWLNEQSALNPYQSDYLLWIDAGLFHNGTFPISYGGTELHINYPASHYYPLNPKTIFTPALLNAIRQDMAQHNGIMLGRKHPEFSAEILSPFGLEEPYEELIHIVGGLFGGSHEQIRDWHSKFKESLEKIMALQLLTTEEGVFTGLYNSGAINTKLRTFVSWNHAVEGDSCYTPEAAGQYAFWEIFRDWPQQQTSQSN